MKPRKAHFRGTFWSTTRHPFLSPPPFCLPRHSETPQLVISILIACTPNINYSPIPCLFLQFFASFPQFFFVGPQHQPPPACFAQVLILSTAGRTLVPSQNWRFLVHADVWCHQYAGMSVQVFISKETHPIDTIESRVFFLRLMTQGRGGVRMGNPPPAKIGFLQFQL